MNFTTSLTIGENIKRLRTERNLTQENLAEHIGISARAVSKWELGKAYPDITLLPGLASYFGVSLDELMSMDAVKEQQQINMTLAQVVAYQANGKIEDCVKYLRRAVMRFPGEYRFQTMLGSMLIAETVPDLIKGINADLEFHPSDVPDSRENYLEAVEYFERVLKYSKDDVLRASTKLVLMTAYNFLKEDEKSKELFEKIPLIEQSQAGVLLPDYLTDEEFERILCSRIAKLTELMNLAIRQLAGASVKNREIRREPPERVHLLRKAIALYELVYEDGGYGKAASDVSLAYIALANNYAKDGDAESALDALEKAYEFAEKYQHRPQVFDESLQVYTPYSAPLVSAHRDYAMLSASATGKTAAASFISETLPGKQLSPIRELLGDSERYKAVIAKFEALAAENSGQIPQTMGFDPLQLKEAADNGDVNSAYLLAGAYQVGFGVHKDVKKYIKYLKQAADGDHTGALNDLANAYVRGEGVEKDYAEAMRLLLKAEEVPNPFGVGNPFARDSIAEMYRDGLGVEQSYAEALKWYNRAAEYQFPPALYALGRFYENGLGVETDLQKALEYYEKAADPAPVFTSYEFEKNGGWSLAECIARVKNKLR